MSELFSPDQSVSVYSTETVQNKLLLKVLDTILPGFQNIVEQGSPATQLDAKKRLLQIPVLQDFFREKNITQETPAHTILDELTQLQKETQLEARIQRPPVEEPVRVEPVVPEEKRESIMEVQEKLNELYRLRNENDDFVTVEKQKINEALAHLKVFGTDIPETEKVEVLRTPGGSVEIIFEMDVEEAEALRNDAEDIKESERRIFVYEEKKAELAPSNKKGIFRMFSGKENTVSQEELELDGKIMRTEVELSQKEKNMEIRKARLEARIQSKKEAFDTPLTITGMDQFEGDWRTLRDQLENDSQAVLDALEQSLSQYDEAIENLEAEIRKLSGEEGK